MSDFLKAIGKVAVISDEDLEKQAKNRFSDSMKSKNQFHYWFNTVEKLGVKTPKSTTIPLDYETTRLLYEFDLDSPPPQIQKIVDQINEWLKSTPNNVGFMKNSLCSAKHYWDQTCSIKLGNQIQSNLFEISQFWAMASPVFASEIVLREMIDTEHAFYAFYGKTPITREFRFFAKDGETYAYQPYWVKDAIEEPSCPDWERKLEKLAEISQSEINQLSNIANAVTKELGDDWSVDFLADKDGNFWLIDMALANESFVSPELVHLPN